MTFRRIVDLIENDTEKEMRKIWILFRYKYEKICLLFLSILFAYLLFTNDFVFSQITKLNYFGYIGVFFAGILSSFGFTAPFSIGFFIAFEPENILLAAILAGLGSVIADLIIFRFVKNYFADEFVLLKKEKIFIKFEKFLERDFGTKFVNHLMYVLAGILIATPLPDEIGVAMIAGLTKVNQKFLAIAGFLLHTAFIYLIFLFS